MIKILIVEDDPMVAEFNKRYVKEIDGFVVAGTVHNVADAIEFINKEDINLLLLDVYMPGANGLELLSYIREQKLLTDVILVTAASDVDNIQTALRYGAVDYLIKPFEFERLHQALMLYKEKYHFFNRTKKVSQEELDDRIFSFDQKVSSESMNSLPKGLTRSTLQIVIESIRKKGNSPFSTDDIAEDTLISRVSVRKYLKFLLDLGVLEESLIYGIGRPVYLYTFKEERLSIVNKYI
jgi:CitB family two-component system response regulator MalR